MRLLTIVGFFLFILGCSTSQLPYGTSQAKELDNSIQFIVKKDVHWQAQWIWMDDSIDNDVLLARKEFQLENAIEEAELLITASSQYQLYINGNYVRRGPARSAPHHQSFDRLEVGAMLHTGKNTIAIRVHHQRGKRSYTNEGRAGLLAQLEIINKKHDPIIIATNNEWKVSPDLSWSNEAKRISRFQLVVNDRVDLREEQKGWVEPSFDDSRWAAANPLMRESGWPAPQKDDVGHVLTPPWTSLVERDVPYMQEENIRAVKLIEARKITEIPIKLTDAINAEIGKSLSSFVEGSAPLNIPASDNSEPWFLLFDLGKAHNGIAQLEIEGMVGSEIRVLSAPFIVNEKFSNKVVFSEFEDVLTLSGLRDKWEATYFKPTRYLAVLIPASNSEFTIYNVGLHTLSYPFEMRGSMKSESAPWVSDYMEATMKTLNACTTDAYTDNYRERRQYAQTGYYAALGNYWTYGDHALQRRYLIQVAEEQQANGIMPAYAPLGTDDFMIILDSNCLYIRSLRNYLLYSGDEKTTRELLPAAEKLMSLLHSFTNELGLINNPPYPYWLDHSQIDRRGANLTLNGHYLGALEDYADILNWLKLDNQNYKNRAALLRSSVEEHFWNKEKQLYADALIDGVPSNRYSEHANAMVLAIGIGSDQRAKQVAHQLLVNDGSTYIKRRNGMTVVTPAMSYFLHKGLAKTGHIDASFQLFRDRFDHMLNPRGNGTLYEEWWLDGTGRSGELKSTSRSDAQTESCFPPALFAEFLLGVQPKEPGLKEVYLTKQSTSLKDIDGVVPSSQGNLFVSWDCKNEKKGMVKLKIPDGMIVHLDLHSLVGYSGNAINVNGKKLDKEHQNSQWMQLGEGDYEIAF